MNKSRFNHASVSMGNKLFVIDGHINSSSEVFDGFSRKFTLFNYPSSRAIYRSTVQAISIGHKIVVFSMKNKKTRVSTYDIINNFLFVLYRKVLENLTDISCVKYHKC